MSSGTIGPNSKPHQCLLIGTWKRTAWLLCWLPRGQQVLHQRSISGNVQIRLSTLVSRPSGDVTRSPKQGYQWFHKKDLCRPKFVKISIQKILNNCETFYLLAFLEAFSRRVASGQVDVCERRDLNERNGEKSGRTPETRHDSFLYIRWRSLRQA